MASKAVKATAVLLIGSLAGASARNIDESKFQPGDILVRDVAVIGGGASGAYAAVRIKDSGKTVVVIDQNDHLVGDPWSNDATVTDGGVADGQTT